MKSKNIFPLIIMSALIASISILTACYPVTLPPEAQAGQLLTENRLTTLEYSLYTNKQVQVFVAAINARQMAISINKTDGELSAAQTAKREVNYQRPCDSLMNPMDVACESKPVD